MKELTLQEIQQGSYKVLLKLKEICDKLNLNYFLAYGTLIGAIRHKGFIPWDDDIDVWMSRPDYERFVKYCLEHEDETKPFVLKHYKTCKEYIYPIARLVDTRYKIDYTDAKEYGLGLFIDIYPLDGVKVGSKKQARKRKRYIRKIGMLGASHYIKSKNRVKNFLKKIYYAFYKNSDINQVIAKADKAAQSYGYDEYDSVACVVWEATECLDKCHFASTVDVEFNGQPFKAPVGYDSLLKKLYGDYMKLPPESEQIAHHYYKAYALEPTEN